MIDQVVWYVNDVEKMKDAARSSSSRRRPAKKYVQTTLEDILINWGANEEAKFIRAKNGKHSVELQLFNSGPYFRYIKKMYKHIKVEKEGVFFLAAIGDKKLGDSAKEVLALIENLNAQFFQSRQHNVENWVTLDQMNEILLNVEEVIENIDAYITMDELLQ